jgi:hypothetical protein
MPNGSFSGPFSRTSGAVISRFRRCLRSAFGMRRSRKVAMVQIPRDKPTNKNTRAQRQQVSSEGWGPTPRHSFWAMSLVIF